MQAGTPTNNTVCANLATCPAGSFIETIHTATTDRICRACIEGEGFTTSINERICSPCRDRCPLGKILTNCTVTRDASCSACGAGEFTNGVTCNPWTPVCDDGYFEAAPPTEINDRVCLPCPQGSFRRNENNKPNCQSWTPCLSGFTTQTQPTPTSDRICGPAAASTSTTSRTAPKENTQSDSSAKDIDTQDIVLYVVVAFIAIIAISGSVLLVRGKRGHQEISQVTYGICCFPVT